MSESGQKEDQLSPSLSGREIELLKKREAMRQKRAKKRTEVTNRIGKLRETPKKPKGSYTGEKR